MDTNEKILDMLSQVQQSISALDERTKNFCEIVTNHTSDISTMQQKLSIAVTDIELLKRDRWWIGTICSFAGATVMFLIQLFMK